MKQPEPTQPITHLPAPSEADRRFAQKVQAVMMPHHLPASEELALGIHCLSDLSGGGYLFDVLRIGEDLLAFLMIDTGGAGMQAALIASMAKNSIVRHIQPEVSPAAVMERFNGELLRDMGTEVQLCAFLGILDLHDNKFMYCNVGCSGTFIFRREQQTIEFCAQHGVRLGTSVDGVAGEDHGNIKPGDCVMLAPAGFFRLFDDAVDHGRGIAAEFIRGVMSGGTSASALGEQLINNFINPADSRTVSGDIALLYAEMLTQSDKNRNKKALGFNEDEIVYLQYLNYLEEMDRITAVILSAMDTAGYPDELIRKMKIVLTELLVNAIVHGNKKESMKKVVVGHTVNHDKTVIAIMDEGDGFDPTVIPDPTLPENIDKPCGRGLFIVRHYVEMINFNRTGNRVTIIKSNTP